MARVRIYTYKGDQIDELDSVETSRSWLLNGYGICTLFMPLINPKTKEQQLRFGNIVLIEGDNLPQWVGFIDTPRRWLTGKIEVTAYSAEKLLYYRATRESQKITGSAGTLFRTLITESNAIGGTPIRPAAIYSDSVPREETLGDHVLEHVTRIASRSGNDWDITPQLSANGKLSLLGNWYKRKGINTEVRITDDHVEMIGVLEEQGDIYNIVTGVGDATTEGTRPTFTARDEQSIAKYGARSVSRTFYGNAESATLEQNTREFLRNARQPKRKMNLTLANLGNIFRNMRIGNTYRVFVSSAGFYGKSSIGVDERVRLIGMKYDDKTNKLSLNVENIN